MRTSENLRNFGYFLLVLSPTLCDFSQKPTKGCVSYIFWEMKSLAAFHRVLWSVDYLSASKSIPPKRRRISLSYPRYVRFHFHVRILRFHRFIGLSIYLPSFNFRLWTGVFFNSKPMSDYHEHGILGIENNLKCVLW